MEKLEKETLELDFFGKKYIFKRLNPFTVRISREKSHSIASFSGELVVDTEKEFYGKPYLIKFKENQYLSPNSMLKLFLKLPLVTKLVLKNDKKSMEIDRHIEYNRVTWHGEVHRGVVCTYVEAEFAFDNPFETLDALVPLRIVNKSHVPVDISKIFVEPENLFLFKGDNGNFTNKVYILVISSNDFSVEYSTKTTNKAVNPQPIIDRKISVARTVLTRFDKFGIARELGL
ncbi:MAG: DUF432 domain-containing protein [Candidatus Methanoperedens sp.]|nr:DUF432 domain-containing protein [Candidatus Methanoperedens sp.]